MPLQNKIVAEPVTIVISQDLSRAFLGSVVNTNVHVGLSEAARITPGLTTLYQRLEAALRDSMGEGKFMERYRASFLKRP